MLEILKNDEVIDRVHPGSRWKVPGEKQVIFNVQADTLIPGYTVREYVEPELPQPSPQERKQQLLDYAAQKRWEKEVGGIVVSGVHIHTDDRSKLLIMGARYAADNDPAFVTKFKFADGSTGEIDAPTIIAISNAVLAHVDACFALEASIIQQIEDGEISSEEEIDLAFT